MLFIFEVDVMKLAVAVSLLLIASVSIFSQRKEEERNVPSDVKFAPLPVVVATTPPQPPSFFLGVCLYGVPRTYERVWPYIYNYVLVPNPVSHLYVATWDVAPNSIPNWHRQPKGVFTPREVTNNETAKDLKRVYGKNLTGFWVGNHTKGQAICDVFQSKGFFYRSTLCPQSIVRAQCVNVRVGMMDTQRYEFVAMMRMDLKLYAPLRIEPSSGVLMVLNTNNRSTVGEVDGMVLLIAPFALLRQPRTIVCHSFLSGRKSGNKHVNDWFVIGKGDVIQETASVLSHWTNASLPPKNISIGGEKNFGHYYYDVLKLKILLVNIEAGVLRPGQSINMYDLFVQGLYGKRREIFKWPVVYGERIFNASLGRIGIDTTIVSMWRQKPPKRNGRG